MKEALNKFKNMVLIESRVSKQAPENVITGKIRIQSTVHEGKEVNYTQAFEHIYKELGYKLK